MDEYLQKINCSELRNAPANIENLCKLLTGNLSQFPFENLDMHMGELRKFSLEDAYDRLINRQLGGFCIQLNGIFCWLLKELKYEVTLHPAYIYNHLLKRYSRRPIHVVLVVRLEGARLFYADVGTTRLVNQPIELLEGVEQRTRVGIFKFISPAGEPESLVLHRAKPGTNEWVGNRTDASVLTSFSFVFKSLKINQRQPKSSSRPKMAMNLTTSKR